MCRAALGLGVRISDHGVLATAIAEIARDHTSPQVSASVVVLESSSRPRGASERGGGGAGGRCDVRYAIDWCVYVRSRNRNAEARPHRRSPGKRARRPDARTPDPPRAVSPLDRASALVSVFSRRVRAARSIHSRVAVRCRLRASRLFSSRRSALPLGHVLARRPTPRRAAAGERPAPAAAIAIAHRSGAARRGEAGGVSNARRAAPRGRKDMSFRCSYTRTISRPSRARAKP